MISAVNSWRKAGAFAGTGSLRSKALVTSAGTATSCRFSSAMSTAAQFFCTTDSPRLP